MKKSLGFTLAEVLITLGIIGVVAAMTIPTLIANTNSAKFRSQYKKTMSTLNQAVRMSVAQYDVDFSMINATCSENPTSDTVEENMTLCGLLNNTLSGASYIDNPFDGSYEVEEYANEGDWHAYTLADGSMFAFLEKDGKCLESDPCYGFIDVNGKILPNIEVNGETKTSYNDLFVPAANAGPIVTPHNPNNDTCNRICLPGQIIDMDTCTCHDRAGTQAFYVPNDKAHMTDVYPVLFYGQQVLPATEAASYVLTTTK